MKWLQTQHGASGTTGENTKEGNKTVVLPHKRVFTWFSRTKPGNNSHTLGLVAQAHKCNMQSYWENNQSCPMFLPQQHQCWACFSRSSYTLTKAAMCNWQSASHRKSRTGSWYCWLLHTWAEEKQQFFFPKYNMHWHHLLCNSALSPRPDPAPGCTWPLSAPLHSTMPTDINLISVLHLQVSALAPK